MLELDENLMFWRNNGTVYIYFFFFFFPTSKEKCLFLAFCFCFPISFVFFPMQFLLDFVIKEQFWLFHCYKKSESLWQKYLCYLLFLLLSGRPRPSEACLCGSRAGQAKTAREELPMASRVMSTACCSWGGCISNTNLGSGDLPGAMQ